MLQFQSALEIPVARVAAVRAGIGQQAEVGGKLRKLNLAAGRQVDAIGERAALCVPRALALGDLVAVEVGPRNGRRGFRRERVETGGHAGRLRRIIPVQRKFDRRLRRAEQIVHGLEAGREIAPTGQIGFRDGPARGHKSSGRSRKRVDARTQPFLTKTGVDGQTLHFPRVHGIDARVDRQPLLRLHGRVSDDHALGDCEVRVRELFGEIAVGAHGVVERAARAVHADLDVVRAGDVRRSHVVAVATRPFFRGRRCRRRPHAEADAGLCARRAGIPRVAAASLLHAWLVVHIAQLDVERIARLEHHPVGERRGPLDAAGGVVRRRPDVGRGFRVVVALHVVRAILAHAVVVGRELVACARLPRDTDERVTDVVVIVALFAAVEVRVRNAVARAIVAARGKEPDLVFEDRTAFGAGEIGNVFGAGSGRQPGRLQPRRQVVALQLARTQREAGRSAEAVAALFGNHVQPHAAARDVGADGRRLIRHLLVHRVVEVALHLAVALEAVHRHAVDHHGVVGGALTVHRHVGLHGRARTADVGQTQIDADNNLTDALNRAARWNVIERVAVERLDVRGALHVDGGRRARHRNGFRDRPDPHLGVHRCGELTGQVDVFALDRLKARQRESDEVHARAQVDDSVLTLAVGHRRSGSLDQHIAAGLNGHTRQHGARRIFDDAGDRALSTRRKRRRHHADN